MENLSGYTPTELLKMINDVKVKHDTLKEEVIAHTFDVEELEKKINEKLDTIQTLEKNYIALIEEINNR
jgi:hypothetical protein